MAQATDTKIFSHNQRIVQAAELHPLLESLSFPSLRKGTVLD